MRTPLANRRPSDLLSFEHGGITYSGSVSYRLEDWRPMEVFMDGGRNGSAVQAVARDTAVAASLVIQYGCPVSVLRAALTRNDDGTPAGPLGALLDLVGDAA